jgi:hypothetical protein
MVLLGIKNCKNRHSFNHQILNNAERVSKRVGRLLYKKQMFTFHFEDTLVCNAEFNAISRSCNSGFSKQNVRRSCRPELVLRVLILKTHRFDVIEIVVKFHVAEDRKLSCQLQTTNNL